jgi:hypothetical protein
MGVLGVKETSVAVTAATNWSPWPCTVRITRWARPLSPTAWRAAFTQEVSVSSPTH